MVEDGIESVSRDPDAEVVRVSLKGSIDATNLAKVERSLNELISSGKRKIVLDCSRLSFICSSGLGMLIAALDEVKRGGGDIRMAQVSPEIYRVFSILGFQNMFEFFGSEEDAVKSFAE